MYIANPIYDVVFKYLMEDTDIAKLIISTIIGEEIRELDFQPQENTAFIDKPFALTIHRLDFSATIKQTDGTQKQALIEIQKAKFPTDILRFRRYLGRQYQDKNNTYIVQLNDGKRTEQRSRPIIVIYFLGYPLEKVTAPIIKIGRQYQDLTTGEAINAVEPFIEQVTHDGYVIQIPHLRQERRSDVERLLMVFDQRWVTADDGRILSIREEDYPEPYRQVIRRLQQAIADEEMRQSMQTEDEVLEGLAMIERDVAAFQEALAVKDQAIAEQQQTLTEQQTALAVKDELLEQKEQTLTEQQKLIDELQQRLDKLDIS